MKKILVFLCLLLFILPDAISQKRTPIMGWSSWNTYHVNISDTLIKKQADALVSTGLKDAGYTYINIDDGYFGGRDAHTDQLLVHATRFPSGLKPVVEHIHGLGLKAGIYSDAGRNTCGSIYDADTIGVGVGLYGHDQKDCDFFFRDLGFDFIKVDYCGGRPHPKGDTLSLDEQTRYSEIAEAIQRTGRNDVRLNICRWDFPGTWAARVASSWRMSQDIRPRWSSVKDIIKQNLYLSAYAYDGHYNDMDMLEVGRGMSEEEDHTHFAVWCMMASPLLIGCDLTKIKPSTLTLLKNQELIAINQDTLHQQAYVAKRKGDCYVLVKDLKQRQGRERAVAFVNLSDVEETMAIDLKEIDLLGDSLTTTIPPHATHVFIVEGKRRLMRTLYEAETAFLTDYQELNNNQASLTAIYEEDSLCSGGVKVSWLGGRATNDLIWREVYVEEDGCYALRIAARTNEPRTFHVDVNGMTVGSLTYTANGQQTIWAELKRGCNVVRLYNDHEQMPDIDFMAVESLKVGVVPFFQGKKAALSLTFDDGLQEHYTLLRPELNRRGLRATFAIIGSKIGGVMHSSQDKAMGISGTPCMDWDMVRQLVADGHEIGSHGWEHRNVTRLSAEQLRHEVQFNDSVIEEQTGCFPISYFYPGNQKDSAAIAFCESGRVGSRTFQTSIGAKKDTDGLRKWLDNLIEWGEWGVGMTHGIAVRYDHFADPQTLWTFLDNVVVSQDSLWVAPFAEVSAYVRERDSISLNVLQNGRNIVIIPDCPFHADLYNQPLTLVANLPEVKDVYQGNVKLRPYQHNGSLMVDFLPNGGNIIIAIP